MMIVKRRDDLSSFSWISQKGVVTLGSFIVITLVCEFFIVSFFSGSGLINLSSNLLVASSLFLILPAVVIIVLILSWIYLIKHVLVGPRIITSTKRLKSHRRRPRIKKKQSFTQSTSLIIKKIFSKVVATFSGCIGDSTTQPRPTFNKVALESLVTILTIFLLFIFLLSILVYPRLFTDFASGFYNTSSSLQVFMKGVAEAMVPLGSGLNSIAPAFRNFFGNLVSVSSQSLTEGDILLRYVSIQSAAACISAFSALAIVKYFAKPYSVVK
jgi:hypothetical protein